MLKQRISDDHYFTKSTTHSPLLWVEHIWNKLFGQEKFNLRRWITEKKCFSFFHFRQKSMTSKTTRKRHTPSTTKRTSSSTRASTRANFTSSAIRSVGFDHFIEHVPFPRKGILGPILAALVNFLKDHSKLRWELWCIGYGRRLIFDHEFEFRHRILDDDFLRFIFCTIVARNDRK